MEKYRFIIAWASGSNGNCGEENGINCINDLIVQYNQKGSCVDMFEFILPAGMDDYAWQVGSSFAFDADYTSTDSLSLVQKLVGTEWKTL